MAQRGRKPKPVEAKVATANPGKRSFATLVPPPLAGEMLCPQPVARNDRARGYWAMYLANVAPGHLTPADAPMLARLCMALAFADQADDMIKTTGMVVKAPKTGLPIVSPYMYVLEKQTEIALKLASKLALTPAERHRVRAFGLSDERPSPWDALDL